MGRNRAAQAAAYFAYGPEYVNRFPVYTLAKKLEQMFCTISTADDSETKKNQLNADIRRR